MSAITIGGDLIHYEKLGRGRPVILLHGWIGSWRYWIPLMQKLHTSFSVYTLDLVGFGDSSKNAEHYDIKSQVTMLEQFLLQLGIPKAAMIGHGLGTLVLTEFALKNPDKVARMLLTSIPLFEPADLKSRVPAGTPQKLTNNDRYSLSPRIEDIPEATQLTDATVANTGSSLDKTLVSGSGSTSGMYSPFSDLPTLKRSEVEKIDRDALRRAAEERQRKQNQDNELSKVFKGNQIIDLLGQCFKKTEPEYEKLRVDVEKTDDSILQETAKDYNAGTLLDDLRRVTAPIVAVHGENDPIFKDPKPEVWNYLLLKKEDVFLPIVLDNVRHFPMLESDAFARLSTDFLSVPDITKIEVRDRWRRRSR